MLNPDTTGLDRLCVLRGGKNSCADGNSCFRSTFSLDAYVSKNDNYFFVLNSSKPAPNRMFSLS